MVSRQDVQTALEENPIIMALKNNKDLNKCFNHEIKIVFVLYGDINTIPNIVKKLKQKNKIVFVHEGLIEGLAHTPLAVDFLANHTNCDGIISTSTTTIKKAKERGMLSVLRFFVLDSLSYQNIKLTLRNADSDFIEILPGLMPRILGEVHNLTTIPVIAGGLIRKKEEVVEALEANAIGISTSNQSIWSME